MKLYTCKVVSLEDFIVIYIYIYSQVCLSVGIWEVHKINPPIPILSNSLRRPRETL